MRPHKNEQIDDGTYDGISQRRRVQRANANAQQPGNLPQREESPDENFNSDKYPKSRIPRRASRYLDPDLPGSGHPATSASEIEAENARRVRPTRSNKKKSTGQYEYGEEQYEHDEEQYEYDEEQYEYDEEQKPHPEPGSKNVASPRRQPGVSPSPARKQSKTSNTPQSRHGSRIFPKRQLRRQQMVFAHFPFLPQFVRRQNLLTICIVIVLLLAFSSLVHSFFAQVPGFFILPGAANNSDPHNLVITPVNSDRPSPPVYAQAAYLLDADTGATLYAHNPFTHLPIMSTTKLMTALLAVEHDNLDQTVTINGQIANDINQLPPDSSNINLKAGESYTLRQLMYGLLLASGNDAAIAIADTTGGSFANFIAMMNQRATDLGLHDTHFENPHGLQEANHYSSAHDLAIIGLNSLGNPLIRQISGTLNYHIDQTPQHAAHDFFNGNQFIWWYPGVDAGKPGYDAATNFVQVVSCVRNNHRLIGVTIHTINWWTDMRDLMNWGFNTFTWLSPHDLNTPDHPIPYANLWNNFADDKKENTIPTTDHGRYYIYTGYSITGDIESYFDKNGGITSFGFPTSPPGAAGDNTLSQRFEHGTIQCNSQSMQCQRGA